MAHLCEAALVTCEDFRLHQRKGGGNLIGEFIASLEVDCDLITRGGCIQDLVRPKPGFDDSLLRDLTVSVELHQVGTIHLVGHEDCGAYGHFGFEDKEVEILQHYKDLREARSILTDKFPDVTVKLHFGKLKEGSSENYEIESLE